MILFENVHTFNSRSENVSLFKINHAKNKLLWITVAAAQGIHIAAMYNPTMQSILDIQPIEIEVWITLLFIALTLIGVMEIEKFLRKRFAL